MKHPQSKRFLDMDKNMLIEDLKKYYKVFKEVGKIKEALELNVKILELEKN